VKLSCPLIVCLGSVRERTIAVFTFHPRPVATLGKDATCRMSRFGSESFARTLIAAASSSQSAPCHHGDGSWFGGPAGWWRTRWTLSTLHPRRSHSFWHESEM